jgi:hypothetical protein
MARPGRPRKHDAAADQIRQAIDDSPEHEALGVCVMARFISFILATGFLTGCVTRPQPTEQATPPPQKHAQAKHSYSVGMSRNEVRAKLADSWLLVSASRPLAGWSGQVSPPAGGFAEMFERSHPGAVEACDVYWVGHTNAPSMYSGKWLNYFYFDRNDKLIGFDRWVIN